MATKEERVGSSAGSDVWTISDRDAVGCKIRAVRSANASTLQFEL